MQKHVPSRLHVALIATVLILSIAFSPGVLAAEASRPNIIIMMADDK